MQHLLSRARVDEQQMLDAAADWAAGHLSAGQDEDASDVVLIVDETADEKSSADCVGAAASTAAPWADSLCQVAVTLAYAAPGEALSSRRARWLILLRSRGVPAQWACSRMRLRATAMKACSRRVFESPR